MEEVDNKVRSTGMVEVVADVMDEALGDANRSNKGGGEAGGQGEELASESSKSSLQPMEPTRGLDN